MNEAAAAAAPVPSDNLGRALLLIGHVGHRTRSSIARAAPLDHAVHVLASLVVPIDHRERVVGGLEGRAVLSEPVRRNRRSATRIRSIMPRKRSIEASSWTRRALGRPPASALSVRRAAFVRWPLLLRRLGAPSEALIVGCAWPP